MKYIGIIAVIIASLIMIIAGAGETSVEAKTNTDFLRIHIRANSNSFVDQNVKYKIKDEVVEALIPVLSTCTTKQEAIWAVNNNFTLIEEVANKVLKNNNFNYSSKAVITSEYFPTRSYNNTVLNSGVYDSLILELGSAKGDNWWCVVYPPLCFVNAENTSTNFVYKSKLLEIVNKFFGR